MLTDPDKFNSHQLNISIILGSISKCLFIFSSSVSIGHIRSLIVTSIMSYFLAFSFKKELVRYWFTSKKKKKALKPYFKLFSKF